MKKFEIDDNSSFTPTLPASESQNSGFDLNKVLQVLQKLNITGLFKPQNVKEPQEQVPCIQPDLMAGQNLRKTVDTMQAHRQFVENMREMKKE